jgi:phospholipid/cholesterol/gamma-HCH transport system permease protein
MTKGMAKHLQSEKDITFSPTQLEIRETGGSPVFRLSGNWCIHQSKTKHLSKVRSYLANLSSPLIFTLELDEEASWDSSLIVFLKNVEKEITNTGGQLDCSSLPNSVIQLLNRAKNYNSKAHPVSVQNTELSFRLTHLFNPCRRIFEFWGKWLIYLLHLFQGKTFSRSKDYLIACRDCGASALPIVTLISYLTGLTMAFVGSVQLEKFNATIYTADLVCLAMVREMGPLMVAIVMAGRTGASFAAELGSMKLNEEIDSLRTFGIPAVDFLVLPRTIALFLMTPLLTLYADIVGILGGLTVGTQVMGFSSLHFIEQTQSALLSMWEVYSGLLKSLAFGLIVGLVGCYKGLHSGSNSLSLGHAVTSSVVVSITLIVITDALFELAFSYFNLR